MTADLHSVAAEALEAVAAAQDLTALDAVRVRYLGRGDGELTAFRRGLGKIADADGRLLEEAASGAIGPAMALIEAMEA